MLAGRVGISTLIASVAGTVVHDHYIIALRNGRPSASPSEVCQAMINKGQSLFIYSLSTGTRGQRRPQSSTSSVPFVDRLCQSGPGGAEEAGDRAGAGGSPAGLRSRETVPMELRAEQRRVGAARCRFQSCPTAPLLSADTLLGFIHELILCKWE